MRLITVILILFYSNSFAQTGRALIATFGHRETNVPIGFAYGVNQSDEARLSNWQALKEACRQSSDLNFQRNVLEVYNPSLDYVQVKTFQRLHISNVDIIVYPFVPRAGYNWIIQIEQGAEFKLNNARIRCAARQNLFESYRAVLKQGDSKSIYIPGETRSDFWKSLTIGQRIYYSWNELVLGEYNTVASYDSISKIITTTNNINASVNPGTSGPQVWIGTDFKQSVNIADYIKYGRHWVRGETSNDIMNLSAIRHGPAPATGLDATIILENSKIENFKNDLDIVSGAFKIVIIGESELNSAELGASVFARSQINHQSITGDTLTFRNNGLISVGSMNFISSRNIYGSGGYVHPTVIIQLEKLRCLNNSAAAFRQYSASIEVVCPGDYFTEIKEYEGVGNGEYDFYSSNCMPVTIGHFTGETALYIGGTLTVNNGDIPIMAATTLLHPPDNIPSLWQFNNCTIKDGLSFGWPILSSQFLNIEFNNCDFISHPIGAINAIIKNDGSPSGYIKINNCRVKNDGSITPYIVGGPTTGTPSQYLLSGFSRYSAIEIDSLITDYMIGGFVLYDSEFPKYPGKFIQIDNSEINLSKLVDTAPTSLPTFLTDQIRGKKTKIVSGYNFSGYNMPISISAKDGVRIQPVTPSVRLIVNKSGESTVINNVLEIDYEHNEYISRGTISHICPITWAGTSKVRSSSMFSGDIKLTAQGGPITLIPYDPITNPYGNIISGRTIQDGETVTISCNNKFVFALGTAQASETVSKTFGFLTNFIVESFSSDLPYNYVDKTTGIYSGQAGANVNYTYFVNWRGTGSWTPL